MIVFPDSMDLEKTVTLKLDECSRFYQYRIKIHTQIIEILSHYLPSTNFSQSIFA
jgi:hypothetical protein